MISGIGIDISECSRFREKADRDFLGQIFTPAEVRLNMAPVMSASGFAVKESIVKALSRGLNDGFPWHDIELTGNAGEEVTIAERLKAGGRGGKCEKIHVSTAQTKDIGISFVIIEDGGQRMFHKEDKR